MRLGAFAVGIIVMTSRGVHLATMARLCFLYRMVGVEIKV